MLGEEHAMVASPQYKEGNMSFWRLIDFLKRFVAANQALIKDHQQKLKAKKKTRRYKLPKEFLTLTDIMEQMLDIFT